MNTATLTLEQPLEIDDARRAARRLADQRREAENLLAQQTEDAAEKGRLYRKDYSLAFEGLTGFTGTAAEREAKARAMSADAEFSRDLAVGMVKVTGERLRGLEGERSQLKTLMEWSARIQFEGRDGPYSSPIGGRRA